MKIKKNIALGLVLLFSVAIFTPSCSVMLGILDASTTPASNTTTDDTNNTDNNNTTPKKGKTQGGGR